MSRFFSLLLLTTTSTLLAVGFTILVASPQTGEEGAEIGNIMQLFIVITLSFSLSAVLLRSSSRRVPSDVAVGLFFTSAMISAVLLSFLIPSDFGGPFVLDRLLALFLIQLPGVFVGLLLFAVLAPRR